MNWSQRAAVVSGLLLFVAGRVQAQDDDRPETRQDAAVETREVVITASAFEEDPLFSPFSTDSVSTTILRSGRFRTLPEALSRQPSVMLQKTAYGQSSPFIRGFTGFRNLMLVDGIRLNHSVFRDGPNQYWSTVDSLSVERLELVRGPSSVLYGSDAIGGTVNAITRRAPLAAEGSGFHSGGALFARYASAEDSWMGRAEGYIGEGAEWTLYGGVSLKDFNDLEAGRDIGRLPATGYEERDADLRFDRYFANGMELTVAAQTARQINVPRTHKTINAVPYAGSTVGSELMREHDQVRDLIYGRLSWDDAGGTFDAGSITLSYHRHDEGRYRLRTGGRVDIQGFDVNDLGFLARFESESSWGRWSWGIEAHHETVDSFRDNFVNGVGTGSNVQGPVGDDASYTTLAAYLQNEQRLSESFLLIPGVRITRASLDADRVANPGPGRRRIMVSDDWTAVTGSLRGVQEIDDEATIYGGISQGFRAPNLSDMTAFDSTSVVETPTTNLDPEHYVQVEVGTKGRSQNWTWQGAVYRTWLQDTIIRSPTGVMIGGVPEVRKSNAGDGWVHGIELDLAWEFEQGWTAFMSGFWMDGEADQELLPAGLIVREPLSRLAPLQATGGVRWQSQQTDCWIEGWFWAVDNQDNLSLRDMTDTERIPPNGTPGYTIYGITFGWEVDENLNLTLTIDNLTDKDYRIHGSGLNSPGRNVITTAELRF